MPNTISGYNTFVQGTKARATEVNQNFSNYRGHLIPINEDTATSSNVLHDLGTTEHRWRNGYISGLYMGLTTTSWRIHDNVNTNTGGDLIFSKNGVEYMRMSQKNQNFVWAQNTNLVATNNLTLTGVSIFNSGGGPIEIGISPEPNDAGNSAFAAFTANTSSASPNHQIIAYRNGTRIMASTLHINDTTPVSYLAFPTSYRFIDISAPAATCTYHFVFGRSSGGPPGTNWNLSSSNVIVSARRLNP